MSSAVSNRPAVKAATSTAVAASRRAEALAVRLEQGARALADLAGTLTDAQWHVRIPKDGREVGVIVHHVASMYPIEISVAQTVAAGTPVVGLTMDDVHAINAAHAKEHQGVTKAEALELLRVNSAAAAGAIRQMSDDDLDCAVPVSLYADAPLTTQLVLEDHAVRHSYHHLAKIRGALKA
jgi:hypothetical protein